MNHFPNVVLSDVNVALSKVNVLVFDVNETLLDLAALDPEFARVFGDVKVRGVWFSQLIQNALLSVITDSYQPFGMLGVSALLQVAARLNVPLTPDAAFQIINGMRSLPPHPEVPAALRDLSAAGFRLCALTNNTQQVVDAQMENAGLTDVFEKILSADSVKRLKPSRAPYQYAARQMNVNLSEICMVAAHAWDVTGALSAGAHACFIACPGMALDSLAPVPDLIATDLRALANQLLARSAS